MSWIQENKFVAGLIGVTAVVGGGILYFGSSQGGAFNEKMQEYETLKSQYASLEKSTPYPNKENLKAREQGIAQYGKQIAGVRAALAAFRPDAMGNITPKEFGDARVKMASTLSEAFKTAGVAMPEDTSLEFGFEKYSTTLPKPAATPKLSYQLGATEWLFTKLAEAKPAAILNIHRPTLEIEDGKAAEPAPKKGKKKAAARKKGAGNAADAKPYELMPMEIAFTADESAVRDFLKEMVNSKEYFYAIRSLRVRNEKQIVPSEKDANFPAPTPVAPAGGELDPFGGFPGLDGAATDGEGSDDSAAEGEAATAAPAPAKVSEVILKRVLGDEKLHVHIVFDVVLLKPKEPAAADAKAADAK